MKEKLLKYKNTNIYKKLEQLVKNFPHAVILSSSDENMNTDYSYLLAAMFLCEKNACLECGDCKKILQNTHPDMIILPEKNNFLVEDSSTVINEAYVKPMLAKRKVFVLNNMQNSTIQAQNKLLKIIEEPPQNVHFILNTTNLEKLLPTIRSRCVKMEIDELTTNDELYQKCFSVVFDTLTNIKSSNEVLNYTSVLTKDKSNFIVVLTAFESIFRDLLMQLEEKNDLITNKSLVNSNMYQDYSLKAILNILNRIIEARKQVEFNVNYNQISDNLLLGILEERYYAKS